MKDRNDSRDISPRIGSPLWIYLTVVTAAGAAVLGAALWLLTVPGLAALLRQPLLWVVAVLALVGQLRPIVTPGKSDPESGDASLTFCFAALLYWGFPVAVIIRAVISLVSAVVDRGAPFRAAFNVAQYVLSFGAAGLVLAAAGIHPQPLAPWLPSGGQLLAIGLSAVAYFAVNFLLVGVAVALHERAPLPATLRKHLPYQAFVSLVLLSAAPLVVVVMGRSVLLVLLFLLPLIAIYVNATMSLQREHQAHHDDLTKLPNRTFLLRRTTEAIAEVARSGGRAGFLLLDLDRFKQVNDTLGHPVGDRLLELVAHRLARSVRPGDVVARLGGDEFAVLLPSVRDSSAAREVAARLRGALAEPAELEGMSFEIEASVGIALCPDDATAVELLMQRADVAMYLAKERRTGVETYALEADRNSAVRLSLLGDLRRGLDMGEVELHYQPKVALADGGILGMEALVRWRHPRYGLIMPADFVPAAEQSYLMRDLTAYLVDGVLAQLARWRASGLGVQVSLNLAARDLIDAGLADLIESGLARYSLVPGDLMLEINERVLAGEPTHAAASVDVLANRGVPISLDDFGTGYSSLVRLKRLPVSEIKIDASFITRLSDSADNELIVRSLVELVRALGIRCVAEGVETAEVAAALAAMGCAGAQGWYFSGPLDPTAATEWLESHPVATEREVVPLPTVLPSKPRRPLSRRAKQQLPPVAAQPLSPSLSAQSLSAQSRPGQSRPGQSRPAQSRQAQPLPAQPHASAPIPPAGAPAGSAGITG
jgi:diguanylate cyclase (GGDEF)-like protein